MRSRHEENSSGDATGVVAKAWEEMGMRIWNCRTREQVLEQKSDETMDLFEVKPFSELKANSFASSTGTATGAEI